jgi:cytochrome P450
MATARKYELYGDEFRIATYETFAQMRSDDPVFCQPGVDGETMLWFVTRYQDVVSVLLDDERFVRDPALVFTAPELESFYEGPPDAVDFLNTHMLNKDGD